jgi:acetate kinase
MSDQPVVLVLNAGSSSLKFSVYDAGDAPALRSNVRGQIEGIGTSPRFSARDGAGAKLEDQALDASVRDARSALEFLAGWLRAAIASSTAARPTRRQSS